MRKIAFAVCVLFCLGVARTGQGGEPGRLGAGVVLGSPSGLSAKYWLDKTRALDAALGFGDISVHADYLRHVKGVLGEPKSGRLAAYWGFGAKLQDRKNGAFFGLRAVGGAAYEFQENPVEIFLEAVPVLRLAPDAGLNLDAGAGVRWYFK